MYCERTDTGETAVNVDLLERVQGRVQAILRVHFPNYFGAQDARLFEEFPTYLKAEDMQRLGG